MIKESSYCVSVRQFSYSVKVLAESNMEEEKRGGEIKEEIGATSVIKSEAEICVSKAQSEDNWIQ